MPYASFTPPASPPADPPINRREVALRIDPEWLIPVDPALGNGVATVLEKQALIIDQGRIIDRLPAVEADQRYTARTHHTLPGHALIPGLINLHTHAAMALMRGFADDRPLMTWLNEHIWPAEKRWVSPEFVFDGSQLACLEMLRAGITCFNDMYFFPEDTVRAAVAAGQRVVSGLIVIDFPSAWATDAEAYLEQGLAVRDRWQDNDCVHFTLAPHAPYSVRNRSLEKVATYSAQLDLPIHMHIHETTDETTQSVAEFGMRPLERLANIGLLGPQLIAVHTVHLQPAEIAQLAAHGVHIAHCPSSNMKLASGFAPIAAAQAAGINVGLGTDSAASNNSLNLWHELRLAALLSKGLSNDATQLPAATALAMATLNAANALGLGEQIGSLSVGKAADMVAMDLRGPETQPCFDPISTLVYSAGREQVREVWVAGNHVVQARQVVQIDTEAVLARARFWRENLWREHLAH